MVRLPCLAVTVVYILWNVINHIEPSVVEVHVSRQGERG